MLCTPPLIQEAPNTPLPDTEKSQEWYGESWVLYPQDPTLYPLRHPHFFKSKCELIVILNRLSKDMYHKHGSNADVSEDVLRKHLIDLGVWHFSLPRQLSSSHVVFPFELNLQ
jgi:hypothetical protein